MKIGVIATSGGSLPVSLFRIMAQRWHGRMLCLCNPYRPEAHYMRGPGPKWHAKHGLPAGV